MNSIASVTPARMGQYVFGAVIALLVIIPLWSLFVAYVIQPTSFTLTQEQSVTSKIWPMLRWMVLLPVAIVALFFGVRWMNASRNVPATVPPAQSQVQHAAASDPSRREYVLEVIGLGVTLDKYRQGKL